MSAVDRDHILRLFSYHHWAERRLLDAFATITASQLDKPWGGSFSTGRGLLEHVVGSDRIWLTRWQGKAMTTRPPFPASYDGKDFAAEWAKLAADEQRFLDSWRGDQLDETLSYVNLKGEPKAFPWFDIFVHVVNHGTYHRGQLSHLLRDLGMTPPSTDYILFIEEPREKR
jgi:uncharacterized damage-inducible protein DinB